MKRVLPALCLLLSLAAAAQQRSILPEGTNPYYWKNRMPDAAYWQQDVHYTIDARMDETEHRIDARESLEYQNNSPDTLRFVYFHLFQNAFIKGSYLHNLEEETGTRPRLGKQEAAGHGTEVEGLTVDGQPATLELDNTILRVNLPAPLLPGASARFEMRFRTWYDRGGTRRRMQMYDAWGSMHYNGVQWFPKICVYDRKFGWDTYQHLNKEFYGDFGQYNVSLDFPSNYILEATGAIQNRDEVLPKDLRDKLDIKNFASKKWNEKPSIIIPYEKGRRKVWRFEARNVHDFAFTADPSFRIATTYWNGIECVGLAQEPHAAGWQNSADYVSKIIQTFSADIGMYGYPKMVAADASDGMEYPMLTLDGGSNPSYHGLLVHEIGHNWFYGMVGSNETYRAALDEGFTQFLTSYGLNKIDGPNMLQGVPKSKYRRRFVEPVSVMDRNVLLPYTVDALNQDEKPLNTHSNDFNDALGHEGGYRGVYYKTASMLYNLQYTLGDSLFLHALQHYFDQWKFAHPYFEDFRNSIIQYTHADLNWFFDEWLETTKTIDYSVTGIRKEKGEGNYAIDLRRKGEMQMPIDLTVTAKDGSTRSYYIPNTWFSKSTAAQTLPKWYGWSKINPEYTAHVHVPAGVRSVQIDTTYRLADKDYTDNAAARGLHKDPAYVVRFDGGPNFPADRRHYRMYYRPDLWYNAVDGVKAGMHIEGGYLNTHQIDATVWLNTTLGQNPGGYPRVKPIEPGFDAHDPVNFTLNLQSPLPRMPKISAFANLRLLDGLRFARLGLRWQTGSTDVVQGNLTSFYRRNVNDLDYLLYPGEWSSLDNRRNGSINLSWTHTESHPVLSGNYTFSLRAPFQIDRPGDVHYDYSYLQFEGLQSIRLKKLEVRTRAFARAGVGNVAPLESTLRLAGANPEQLMEDKYTRSRGLVPESTLYGQSDFQLQQGGGLNLRGFAGQYPVQAIDGLIYSNRFGRSGASVTAELDFDGFIPLHPAKLRWLHLDTYVFGDAGAMVPGPRASSPFNSSVYAPIDRFGRIYADAGAGLALTIRSWGVFEKARPLTLRFDVPFLVNEPGPGQEMVQGRYVFGVNRTF